MQSKFLRVQVRKIEIDKWCEGCALQDDPGQDYVFAWIKQNAAWFRDAWNHSLCRHCQSWRICGHRVLKECREYKNESLDYAVHHNN
ncbi:hypothetical protein JW992_12640 [candidate division KSB1 bacterium]|nr:hypothetical protein [candidate division KSB1 bacterium]